MVSRPPPDITHCVAASSVPSYFTNFTNLLTVCFQREFREICISFGWQRNGTSAAAADADEAGDSGGTVGGDGGNGDVEPSFMGVSIAGLS